MSQTRPGPGKSQVTTREPRILTGQLIRDYLTTTDHKKIAHLYLITSFGFFLFAGMLAMVMRAELARPGLQIVTNELFTIHGTIMMLLFATPTFAGFANAIMPLQIGAPDVAFPRLNALSYWLFLFGGLIVLSGFLVDQGPAPFGWFAYSPLNNGVRSPGHGRDLWAIGLAVAGVSTTLGAVNFIATILCLRVPGMTMFRMPIFTWNILFTSILVLLAFPVFTAILLALVADRVYGAHIFDSATGGALLWQHLFWFFGHPEVYIVALPFFGVVTEIFPVFSRKPVFGYVGMGGCDHRDHDAVGHRMGSPHVRHGRRAAAVLLPDVVPDRRPDGSEVLQLDRHHVAGQHLLRDTDAVVGRVPGDLPARRAQRCPHRLTSAGLPPD
ncbi:heme/copper-type cytochrome/quinol oxidase subunit 1 [Streptomyces rapamycinicus]|uniref:Heme/copper-type cytochrome/quinol oxidase subunit 1 n=1 Tax=Streptomyces rapamycinicus TaxID=1226757 RepID=A0ABR6LLK5_9ACTN|nr:heme/copper-type cytochrome/quinol oxidase subunit 1 [Streptomyces rapamycinicus]